MQKILLFLAHPRFERSRTHAALLQAVRHLPGVTIRDLYELYPEFDVDVAAEQALLLEHDIIIWQHPLYWYSCPPLLKQWIDMVLTHGWAYGKNGTALEGKYIFSAISSGGPAESYRPEGLHRHTIREFLLPFEQTARLCRMNWLPPFVVHNTHQITAPELSEAADQYGHLLQYLHKKTPATEKTAQFEYINHWLTHQTEQIP